MGREGWREERAWLGRAFWGGALLGGCWEAKEPAGWRLQMAADAWGWGGRCVAGGACGWNVCCRPGKVKLLVRNEVKAEDVGKKWTIWGNYASRSGRFSGVCAAFGSRWALRAVRVCCWSHQFTAFPSAFTAFSRHPTEIPSPQPPVTHSSLLPLPPTPPCPVNTSSPLLGSFAPQNLFKRARHSTSSNTLFTLSLPL